MRQDKGQSLVEVVVSVGMMSLILVALLALVSLSIKNSRMAQNKTTAVALAQEGVELMRTYRDYSWQEFYSYATSDDYELNNIWTVDAGGLPTTNCNEDNFMYEGSLFSRCVRLESSGADLVLVGVTVYWREGPKVHSTLQSTNLSIWER